MELPICIIFSDIPCAPTETPLALGGQHLLLLFLTAEGEASRGRDGSSRFGARRGIGFICQLNQ